MNHKFNLPSTLDTSKEYTDEELMQFIPQDKFKAPSKSIAYANWYVIDGIPKVPEDKAPKLKQFFNKFFKQLSECDIKVENGKTTGLMFVKSTLDLLTFNNTMMDKKHTLSVLKFIDFFQNDFDIVKPSTHITIASDLLVFAGGKAIEASATQLSSLSTAKSLKTVKSFKNSYTWIENDFVHVGNHQYKHPNCKDYFLSPLDSILVTWSTTPIQSAKDHMPYEYDGKHILVWHTTGICLFGLEVIEMKPLKEMVKLSDNDAILVHLTNEELVVYNLLDPKFTCTSIKSSDIESFQMQPNSTNLCYFQKATANAPARVCLVNEQLVLIKSKNLFNVTTCLLSFCPRGIYCLASLTRLLKSKKVSGTSLELFHLKDKNVPVTSMTLNKERVVHISWDFKSNTVVLISVDEDKLQQQTLITKNARREEISAEQQSLDGVPNQMKIRFCTTSTKDNQCLSVLHTLENTSMNYCSFTPSGRICVVAGTRALSKGHVHFYDTGASDGATINKTITVGEKECQLTLKRQKVVLVNSDEHYKVSQLEWDYTGRYLCTVGVSGSDAGYKIWDLMGTLKNSQVVKLMESILWIKSKPLVLDAKKVKKIKQTLNTYAKRFEAEDSSQLQQLNQAETALMKKTWEDWIAFRQRVKKWRQETKDKRFDLFKKMNQTLNVSLEDYYSDTEDMITDLQPEDDKFGYTEAIEVE